MCRIRRSTKRVLGVRCCSPGDRGFEFLTVVQGRAELRLESDLQFVGWPFRVVRVNHLDRSVGSTLWAEVCYLVAEGGQRHGRLQSLQRSDDLFARRSGTNAIAFANLLESANWWCSRCRGGTPIVGTPTRRPPPR